MTHQESRPGAAVDATKRRVRWAFIALAAFVVAIWANSVPGQPIFDDHILVVGQECIRTVAGVLRIFQFESDYACTYRPIRYLSYGVDDALFGGQFWGFHIGNIVNHLFALLMAAGLVAELARRSQQWQRGPRGSQPSTPPIAPLWIAFVAVALWAVHPVQTDSVSYVSGRRDILAGAWTFASVWAALVADRRGGLWWLAPLWATLIAFLSKESAVVVPVLFLLWKVREVSLKAWLKDHLATAIALFVGLLLSFLMVLYRGVFASMSHRGFEWWGGSVVSNFATVAVLQVHYLRHVFLGHPLIGDYQAETIALATSFADPRALLGIAVIVGVVAVGWVVRRRRPLITYGIGWYLVCLAPVSHFFPHHELFAEHYLYIPLLGIVLALVDAVAWAIERAPERLRWERIGVTVLAIVIAVMGLKVTDRNRDFADERAFYTAAFAHAPNNVRVVANLGNIHFDAQEFERSAYFLGLLADQWIPGSAQERVHVHRLVEAAFRSGDRPTAWAAAQQLATHHPDVGAGHKWVAAMAHEGGDYATSFDACVEWWRTTLDLQALQSAMAAWHAGGLDAARAAELATMVEDANGHATPPSSVVIRGTADALRRSGDRHRALDLLRARRDGTDPELDRAMCILMRELQPADLPGWCAQ